jgi:hypothetical protein
MTSYIPQIYKQPYIYSSTRKYEVTLIMVRPTNEFLFTTQVKENKLYKTDQINCNLCKNRGHEVKKQDFTKK